MGVNEDFLESRIAEINDAIKVARSITSKEYGELSLEEKLALRYLVIQLVEAAASICIHVLSEVYGERARGFPHCFIRLGEKGLLPHELAEKLARAARLRSLLIHRYWVINDEKVYLSVKKGLGDFVEFVRIVRGLMGG